MASASFSKPKMQEYDSPTLMRDPRTITEQLDGLLSSAEETERGVRDMEETLGRDSIEDTWPLVPCFRGNVTPLTHARRG